MISETLRDTQRNPVSINKQTKYQLITCIKVKPIGQVSVDLDQCGFVTTDF